MAKGKKLKLAAGPLIGGVAGGLIGNRVNNLIEKQMIANNNVKGAKYAPALTGIAGIFINIFAPEKLKSLGLGMFAVATTEVVENLIKANRTTTATPDPGAVANAASSRVEPNANAANTRVAPNRNVNKYHNHNY